MSPKERYHELTERLLENTAWDTLTEEEDESIREEMDDLWWAMSEKERAEADAWLAAQRVRAPEDLGLVDAAEDGGVHRRAIAA